jgi:PAS domain S-box-containing protein
MIASTLTPRHLWIGALLIVAYLVAAIGIFVMISDRIAGLGRRDLATVVWSGARLQTEFFRLRHAVENLRDGGSRDAADEVHKRYEIVLNRLNVIRQGQVRDSYDADASSVSLFEHIDGTIAELKPKIARAISGDGGPIPEIERAFVEIDRPIAAFGSALVNLVASDLRNYDLSIADQTRFLSLLLLGQILTAILFFVILARQVNRLGLAQDALVLANRNLRDSESEIRQSRSELATAQQRLLDGIEAIPDAFALYDAEDRLVVSNSVMRSAFCPDDETIVPGATFEQILRRRVAAGRVPLSPEEQEQWIAARLDEHRRGATARDIRMDGDRTFRIAERRTVDGGIVTVISDITDIKERERRLRESREILSSVLNHIPVLVTMTDASRRLMLLNRAAEQRYGVRASDAIGRDLLDVLPERDRNPGIEQSHAKLVADRRPQIGLERKLPGDSGEESWIINRIPVLADDGSVKFVIRTAYEVPQLADAYHALADSRTRLLDAIKRAKLTYWVGSEDGTAAVIGPGAAETLGFPADTLTICDDDYLANVHEADRERVIAARAAASGGVERAAIEYRFARPDNVIVWIRETGEAISGGADGRFRRVGTLQDVTEQKQVEIALRQSEARLKGFLDHAPMMMYLKDIAGRFVLVNREFERVAGSFAAHAVGSREADLYPPSLAAEFAAHDRSVIQKRGPVSREFTLPMPTPEYRDVMTIKFPIRGESGRITAIGGFTQDIAERKRAERTLRENESRLRRAQQQARLTYWTWDLADHRYEWAPGSGALLGIDDAALPTRLAETMPFLHADDRERMLALYAAVEKDRDSYEAVYRLVRPTGGAIWVREHGDVERDADGRRLAVSGTLQDISPYRKLEEQLIQAQKVEALGQLTGGIAHDFNNLLAVILGNLDLLADYAGLPPQPKRHIELARRAAARGAEMTRRLLIFARRQPLAPRVTDVNELIRNMADLLRRPLGNIIEIRFDLKPDLWPTEIDQGQMEMTLLNLGLNARDAMPDGGILRVTTDNVRISPDQDDAPKDAVAGDYVRIIVSDTGGGMTPDVVARAFDPFFSTKDIGRGTGLGLSMAYGFVTQSGGHIDLSSAPGRGTIVRILLPRSAKSLARVKPDAAGPSPLEPASSERVLVIEDDDDVRQVVVEQLASLGFQVAGAPDGASALTLIDKNDDFDLFVLDIVLPGGVRGTDIARLVRERRPDAKILYMSGFVPEAGSEQDPLDPPAPCLTKPFDKKALTAMIEDLYAEPPPRRAAPA